MLKRDELTVAVSTRRQANRGIKYCDVHAANHSARPCTFGKPLETTTPPSEEGS